MPTAGGLGSPVGGGGSSGGGGGPTASERPLQVQVLCEFKDVALSVLPTLTAAVLQQLPAATAALIDARFDHETRYEFYPDSMWCCLLLNDTEMETDKCWSLKVV
jgi:hypothetical protein